MLLEEIAKFNIQNMGIVEEDAMKEIMKLMDKEKTSEYLNLLSEVEVLLSKLTRRPHSLLNCNQTHFWMPLIIYQLLHVDGCFFLLFVLNQCYFLQSFD